MLALAALCALLHARPDAAAPPPEPRVVLVTIDGVRWQEVFRGADRDLSAQAGLPAPPAERDPARRALMPFLWGTIAAEGQIFGDADHGAEVRVTNPFRKSYPGYHELLCGWPSLTIFDNRKVPNPDANVLGWLAGRPGFAGRVAAFTAWEVFDAILDRGHEGLLVARGGDPLAAEVPPPWKESVYDAFVVRAALRHLEEKTPRVLYLALNDADEWGHAGRYDRYLEAIRRADGWLGELWGKLQAMPAYRGRTSLVVTTDHGRGDSTTTWVRHGLDVAGSERAWVAVLGPGAAALGVRAGCQPALAQVAATMAALAGEDFRAAVPRAAAPLPLGKGGCEARR